MTGGCPAERREKIGENRDANHLFPLPIEEKIGTLTIYFPSP